MTADPQPPAHPFRLDGRTALVVGAGRPLGRAVAAALAEAGADVAVASLSRDPQEIAHTHSVANHVWSLGRRNLALELDATDPADVEQVIQHVDDAWGRIDVLVNAQDLVFAMPFDETGRDEWDQTLAANLTSVMLTCQAAGHVMMRQGGGRIINVVGVPAARGVGNMTAYATAKGGVLAFSRALSQEWARAGITVNVVQIGFYADQAGIGDRPEHAQALARMLPARALVQSGEIAGLVVLLAADTGFLTGQVIALDGGASQRV